MTSILTILTPYLAIGLVFSVYSYRCYKLWEKENKSNEHYHWVIELLGIITVSIFWVVFITKELFKETK